MKYYVTYLGIYMSMRTAFLIVALFCGLWAFFITLYRIYKKDHMFFVVLLLSIGLVFSIEL